MNQKKSKNNESYSDNICPVSGLPIIQKPEWINVSFDKDFHITFSILGGSVLLVQVSGRATLHGLKHAAMFLSKIETEVITKDRFIRIEEWSNIKGVSREARRYYIDYIKNQKRLLGLIFCGLSPMLKTGVKLGKRFNILKFNVHIVDDYSDAVRLAKKILAYNQSMEEESSYPETVFEPSTASHEGRPHRESVTNPEWNLQYENFSLRFEVIGGNVLHGITTGRLEAEHIAPSFKLQDKILLAISSLGGHYYFVLGMEKSEGTGQKARKLYADAVLALYKKYPFRIFIFYGANKLMEAGINLYRPFVPFKVKIVKDLDSALKLIAKENFKAAVSVKRSTEPNQIQQYVDELLKTIEGLDWETGGISHSEGREPSHPFHPVFEAIDLIKWELDDLFQKQRQTMEKLEKAYKELKSTQAQLIQSGKLSSIGELASGVAHELNQPLTVIRGNAQLIQRNLQRGELNVEKLSEQIEPINRNTKRMMNIISHLRTFSRQSQSDFQPVDVNKIVDNCFLMVGEQLRLRNIDVERNLNSDLPMINGDANQLEQVFLNLITNARDAITSIAERRIRDGNLKKNKTNSEFKGRLEIISRIWKKGNTWPRPGLHKSGDRKMEMKGQYNQEDTQITSHLPIQSRSRDWEGGQQSKDFIEILVRDNGGGIPADIVDKIFDPFFTTKEVGKGTGLGLSISYGIIEDHKGKIEVVETGTEGTTFRVKLPVMDIQLT